MENTNLSMISKRTGLFTLCFFATLAMSVFSWSALSAQNVNVAGAVVGNGTYPTLTAAFAAINAGGQGGATIAITIVANTNEGTGTALLTQSTTPWVSLSIQPLGGAFTITGATTAGSPLINISGADNVTIDGLNTSGNALTIQNTTVSGTSGTSTIKLEVDAVNNLITRCAIQGSATMPVGTNGGNIWISSGAIATGTDNNTISFCDIGPAGTNLPSKGVYSSGSTGTTTLYNSGNQVLNCNIFDCFGAAATSASVYLGGGNLSWTISNNKFYQTATRTQTTGAVHAGIQIGSSVGNESHVISNNTIGYSSAAGTGTYTLVGLSGTRFFPIFFSSAGTNAASTVTGNTITNIAMSGAVSGVGSSSPFTAILVSSGIVNITNNTLGSQSVNGALSFTSSSTSASDIAGYYNVGSSATTFSNNTLGGLTAGNSSTGTLVIYGVRINTSSSVTSTIQNNQLGGAAVVNSIQNTAVASISNQIVGIQINSSAATISGNTISNMSLAAGNGTGSTASVAGIIVSNSSSNHTITGNTIAVIGNLNPASTGQVCGIVFSGSTSGTNLINRNTIHSLIVQGAGATLNGISVIGGTNTFANNMIRLGIDPTGAAFTFGCAINGVSETTGTDNFYHNSIYIGGAGVAGATNTFAFNSTVTTNVRNFQDNIFYNARSNGAGTGKHYAMRVGGSAANPAGLTSNYNLLFANGTGGFVGLFNALDQATIAAWRLATGQDNNSLNLDPNFVLPTGNALTGDLHIASPTPIESNGTNIVAVTDDIDGQTRSGLSPVDIGADAGNFTASIDLTAPSILYTVLPGTCLTGDRTLIATITDASGVPTTGLLQPRIYFRKNASPYVSSQGVLTTGTGTNGTWTFTISAAALGGVAAGDLVSYYVIAQDIAGPFIAASPGAGLVATDVNTVTTPPTSPNSYSVNFNLNGTYTVGATGNFATLTAAVSAYNSGCLAGPVLFNLIDANYPSETFPIVIGSNPAASAVNTLTIKPTVTTTITGSNANSIITMSGADYVTIDGSIGNTPNTVCPLSATTRNLTITNTLSSSSPAVVWLATTAGGNAVTNCTVQNCVIVGQGSTTTQIGLGAGGPTISNTSTGTGNNNLAFVNNDIRACQFGIYSSGANATTKNQSLVVNQNLMTATAPNNVGISGIFITFSNDITVSGNTVSNLLNSSSSDLSAINLGFASTGGLLVSTTGTADGVSNATITSNTIGTVQQSGTFSAAGIALGNTISGTSLIANNMIYGVSANSTPSDFVAGIALGGGTGAINVFHNSVWMQGTITGASAATSVSACLAVTASSAPTGLNIRNNVFHNTQVGNTSSTMRFVAIGYQFAAPFTTVNSNYNDFFSAGTGPGTYFIGTTGGLSGGTTAATLAAWQTATSGDANSVNVAPVFVSATDLHAIPVSNVGISNMGTNVAAVTTDVDCATRNASTPDIGADEFDIPACAGTPTPGTAAVSVASICQGLSTTLNLTGFTTGVGGISFQWQIATVPGGPYTNIGGATTSTFVYTGAPVGTNYIVCNVTCANGGASALSNEVLLTVTPTPVTSVTPTTGLICNPGGTPVLLTASSTGGTGLVNFTWNPTVGLAPTSGSPVTANPAANTVYTVTGTDAAGCFSTATATISLAAKVTIDNISATPSTICAGNTSALSVAASIAFSSNYAVSTVPFAPIASGTGTTTLCSAGTANTALTSGSLDDGNWNGLALPFSFTYFGTAYNSISVGTNGYVSFTSIGTTTGYNNTPQIPNATAPNNMIAGCFGDLYWTTGGTISTYTSGTAPNRIYVINFDGGILGGFYNLGSAPTAFTTFQIQLFESNNTIQVQTTLVNSDATRLHTMGIENVGGTAGFTASGRDNALWSLTNNGTQFTPLGTFTYAWTPALGLTPSAAFANPTTPALATTTPYNVTVTDAQGCAATGSVTVTVNPVLVPAVSITAAPGSTICTGDNVTFTAASTNAGATPIYVWKKNGSAVGTNSTTYSDNALANGDLITCDLTSNALCAAPTSVTSNTITMIVNPIVTPTVSIAVAPSATICAGDNVTFTATPVNGGATPVYQWKKNGSAVGLNTVTYTDNALTNGDAITCEVTSNAPCPSIATVTSNSIVMVVNPVLTPSVSIVAAPGTTICDGDNVTFTATPVNGGTIPAYQWKLNGTDIGTNSNTYTDNTLANGDVITCVLTSNAVCAAPIMVTSNALTMTVNPILTPSVSIAAAPSTVICAGTSVTFSATVVNGGTTPTYQWKLNGSNDGTNSATYANAALSNGDVITCEVTSNATCAVPTMATSNALTMTVNPVLAPTLSISANPGTSICAGTNITFTAVAVNGGSTPTYQWRLNGGAVGTNSDTYSNALLGSGDLITCEITSSDPCSSPTFVVSNTLTISAVTNTVPTVTISASPGQTICPGTSATFTAVPNNAGITPSYQWKLNSSNVGTNSATYTNGGLTTGDVVTCVVTSSDPCALPITATSNAITMTVADLTNPIAVCQPVTIALNGSGNASTTASTVNNGSSDNCTATGALGLALSTTTFTCAQLGANTVTLTVTDAAARTGTCSATVTVTDAILPIIACPSNATSNNTTGQCAAVVTYTAASAIDNCTPVVTQTAGLASGASFPVGVTTNTFRATDAAGNTATCSFTVTVTDIQVPAITCPANTSVSNGVGLCAATVSYTSPIGTDNCPSPATTQTAGLASGATFPIGATTNTFRVTDAAGNTATCAFTVTVTDNQVPTITCPTNISVNNGAGLCAAIVTYTSPVGIDNCPSPVTTLTAGLASGASFPVGVTTNTFRATDAASNTATCSFTVTVVDNTLPTITCPANITANNGVGLCAAIVTYAAPIGADNCTPTTTQTAGLASGASYPVGVTTNTFRVTDAASNSATCSFTVTVVDNTLPTITCPANISVNNASGLCAATVTYAAPVGADNCTPTTTQTAGLASGASFPVGVTTNTFRVTDAASNSATCSFTVTVVDNQLPGITCPANISVSASVGLCAATATYTAPVGTDNCALPTITQTAGLASGASFPVGVTTNTFRATDAASNSATCSFTVTVSDNQLPQITCPANVVVGNDVGVCGAIVTFAAPVGTDNCSATTALISGNASGTPFTVGTSTVTFRATDAAGNSATCSFTVTVNDTEAPTWAACPANRTVSTSTNSCDAIVSWTVPTAADQCSVPTTSTTHTSGSTFVLGTTTVIYSAVDAAGNTATCTFTVTVNDSVAPTALCQGVTVTLDAAGNGSTTSNAVNNGSTDNCAIDTVVLSQTAFTCADAGVNTVTLIVTDAAGNTSTCTAIVTVVAPAVTGTAIADTTTCGYNISCNGGTDGVATAAGAGGCPSYTYLWSNNANTATVTGLAAGTYTVTITDGAGGLVVKTVTLTQPAAITATAVATSSCAGDSTGAVNLTPAGGNDCLGYTFLWSNGATTEDLSNVPAGTYTVTVTDANACTGTQTVTVGAFAALNPTISNVGNLLSSVQVWTSYQWLLNGNTIPGATASGYTATATGSYSLLVTDANGCTAVTDTLNVTLVGISDPALGFIGLSIYPNPARGEFKLLTEQPITQSLTVSIFDMYGHRFTQQYMPSLGHEVAFDINGYSAGNYLVEVVSKTGHRKVFKLVVQ